MLHGDIGMSVAISIAVFRGASSVFPQKTAVYICFDPLNNYP
jgi:hypothetical protein